jgi:hypothetical protein
MIPRVKPEGMLFGKPDSTRRVKARGQAFPELSHPANDLGNDLSKLVWHSGYPNFRGDISRCHNILMVVSMAMTTMSRLLVTFYRHRTRPGVIAVSPVSTNLVFPEPDDWELERQDIINPIGSSRARKSQLGSRRFGALVIAFWSQADRARQRAKTMPIPDLQKNGADTIARPPPRASSYP